MIKAADIFKKMSLPQRATWAGVCWRCTTYLSVCDWQGAGGGPRLHPPTQTQILAADLLTIFTLVTGRSNEDIRADPTSPPRPATTSCIDTGGSVGKIYCRPIGVWPSVEIKRNITKRVFGSPEIFLCLCDNGEVNSSSSPESRGSSGEYFCLGSNWQEWGSCEW